MNYQVFCNQYESWGERLKVVAMLLIAGTVGWMVLLTVTWVTYTTVTWLALLTFLLVAENAYVNVKVREIDPLIEKNPFWKIIERKVHFKVAYPIICLAMFAALYFAYGNSLFGVAYSLVGAFPAALICAANDRFVYTSLKSDLRERTQRKPEYSLKPLPPIHLVMKP